MIRINLHCAEEGEEEEVIILFLRRNDTLIAKLDNGVEFIGLSLDRDLIAGEEQKCIERTLSLCLCFLCGCGNKGELLLLLLGAL